MKHHPLPGLPRRLDRERRFVAGGRQPFVQKPRADRHRFALAIFAQVLRTSPTGANAVMISDVNPSTADTGESSYAMTPPAPPDGFSEWTRAATTPACSWRLVPMKLAS